MHVQIVNFRLKDLTVAEYELLCDKLAPAFAAIPGLLSKVWLADHSNGTFGGVYTWQNRTAMEAFMQTELFRSVVNHPALRDLSSVDFTVMDRPTRLTHGFVGIAA